MNTDERNRPKPADPQPTVAAVELDTQAALHFENWLEQSLIELVDRHVNFSTPNSNQKYFSRRSSGAR